MDNVRVLIDAGDPCPDCGAPATVFEREDVEILGWIEEYRECGHGCAEVAAALSARPAPRVRRRAVA
jgi:hypothetical protein